MTVRIAHTALMERVATIEWTSLSGNLDEQANQPSLAPLLSFEIKGIALAA
ncbi:MAG: hypothetical protein P0111_00690 [Nitrospira sp.]|nr:hypothetical protein [Nitrospira sp.]